MTDCQEYEKLHDRLILDYITIFEYRRYRELEEHLGFEKEEVELVSFLNPILRDKPVFNPLIEICRLAVREIKNND